MNFSKTVNNKKHAPKLIFFNEKKNEKDSDNFWHRKLTLKVRYWLFSIAWFRAGVDLTKYFFLWKNAIFHSIKLPFDEQVVQKILNIVYCTWTYVFFCSDCIAVIFDCYIVLWVIKNLVPIDVGRDSAKFVLYKYI